MGKTVDDKVVAMSFEHSKFESGVSAVMSSLDKLKAALHFPNAGKGLQDVSAAANKVDLSHIASGLDSIKQKFSAMSVVALSVLANIANRAVAAGANIVKSLTIGPISGGLKEYETNLNSVQTILANTAASGADLKDVNAALLELNHYSDQTIYNFSEMAKNIGTFTAAGVDLETSTASIKGIANLAAVSGSNSQQASTAMYQLSQAISSGRVSLQDWNSVVNAGMGGTVFQRALAQTAENMGALSKGSVELKGKMKNVSIEGESFRNSIMAKPGEQSWLTSDVLTETLKQFTGDLTDAELAAQGFSKAQIKAIQDQATMAVKAATEVKTLTGVLDTARESAGSGWAQTWQIIFGDFGEAKELFTGVSTAINGFIGASADARNKVLGDWKALGGRTILISGIKNIFTGLATIIKPIKEAFRDIFPATTGKQLVELTRQFTMLTARLQIGPETANNLKRTFRGVFSLFKIGVSIVSGVFTAFKAFFGAISEGSGGFLKFTGSLGDNLTALNAWLQEGDRLHNFFVQVGAAMAKPIHLLGDLKDKVTAFWDSLDMGTLDTARQGLGDMNVKLTPMQKLLEGVSKGWDGFVDILGKAGDALRPVVDAIGEAFGGIGAALADSLQQANFDQIMDVIKTGLFGGLVLTIKNFLKKDLPGAGLFDSIGNTFDALTGKLTAMQNNVKADTLQKIAIAVGILTVSVVALSMIDSEKLTKALTAMAVGFGQLVGAMAILSAIGTTGFLKVPFIAASMIMLASAILILTAAVKNLSSLSWQDLAKGLTGVGVLLGAIAIASGPLSKNAAGMIRAGVGIAAIAIAMKILASAVKDFGAMSWTEIGKGLAAVAVALAAIGLASKLFPPGMVGIGVGLIAVAGGLNLLAMAVRTFGEMDLKTLGIGMGAIAVSLGLIVAAMILMPPNMPATAIGLLLVSAALMGISKVIASFGGMSIEALAKGIGSMALSLGILAVAMYAMIGTLPGAAALVVAAAALSLLAPAMERLGKQSWEEIIKGMVALAGALVIMGTAAVLLAPVAPALLAMGAALLLIGGGLALAGAGIFLLGTGLAAIVVAGPAAIAIIISSLVSLVEAIPRVAESFIMGFLRIVDMLAAVAPRFAIAIVKIVTVLIQGFVTAAPKLGEAFLIMITAGLKVLDQAGPKMIETGFKLLKALLQGLEKNIGQLTITGINILTKLLTAISNNLGRVQKAGVDLLGKFLSGMGSVYGKIASAGGDIIAKIIGGLSSALSKIQTAGTNLVTKFISGMGTAYTRIISAGAAMIARILTGIGNAAGRLVAKGTEIAGKFINAVASAMVKLTDEGAKAIINFLNGIATVIRNRGPEMRAAGSNIATAIAQGFLSGLNAADLVSSVINKFRGVIDAAKRAVKAKSPSQEFYDIGQYVVQGFALGVKDTPDAENAVVAMSNGLIETTKSIFKISSPSEVFKDIGKFIGKGFAEGLLGSEDDITNAFEMLNEKLNESIVNLRETMAREEDKLDKLQAARGAKRDAKKIAAAKKALEATKALYAQAVATRKLVTDGMKLEQIELNALAVAYADVTTKLEEATKQLETATKTRDDFNQSTTDKYSTLPDIDTEAEDQVGTFTAALSQQVAATEHYQRLLANLRGMGLDDNTYKMLLEEGTAGTKFAEQLLAGGPSAVASVAALSGQLTSAASVLGQQASADLYQAGVNAAQGLVNGLASKQAELFGQIEALITKMITTIKKKLKIKSPSEVFAEIGKFTAEGLAKGLEDTSHVVSDAAASVADAALETMAGSMSSISDLVSANIDANPTITPVLDLSQVQKEAQDMASMLGNVVPITAASSYGQAAIIAAERLRAQNRADNEPIDKAAGIVFQQTNNSPKALSEVEIFRRTKNMLSLAKQSLA